MKTKSKTQQRIITAGFWGIPSPLLFLLLSLQTLHLSEHPIPSHLIPSTTPSPRESDQNYSHHSQVQVPKAWARYPSVIHTSQDAPRGVSSLVSTCPSPLLRGSTPGGLARLVHLSRKSNTQKQGGKLSSPCPMRCDPPCSDYLCLSRTWLPCKPTKQKRAWAGLWGHFFFLLSRAQ
ncbi:hypothetical protein V8C43DRAFT_223211 [Trichoderma afarasin]